MKYPSKKTIVFFTDRPVPGSILTVAISGDHVNVILIIKKMQYKVQKLIYCDQLLAFKKIMPQYGTTLCRV